MGVRRAGAVRGRQLFSYVSCVSNEHDGPQDVPLLKIASWCKTRANSAGSAVPVVSMTTDRADFFFLRSAWRSPSGAQQTHAFQNQKRSHTDAIVAPEAAWCPSPASIYA